MAGPEPMLTEFGIHQRLERVVKRSFFSPHQVAVMRKAKDNKEESRMVMLPVEEVEKYVTEIEEEKEKEAAAKRPAEKTSD